MQNKFKYLILLLMIIFLTGCSGNYNLIINDDLTVKEEVELSIENTEGNYQKTLNLFEQSNISKKKYNVVVKDNNIEVTYSEKYDSVDEYILRSKLYKQLFSDLQYNKNSKYIDLYVDENMRTKNQYNRLNGSDLQDFDVIQVNITNPFKVNLNNAEIMNDKTYTWTIKGTDTRKKIQMQFIPKLDRFPYKALALIIVLLISGAILSIRQIQKYKKRQNI